MRYSSRLFLYAPLLVLAVLAVAAGLRWQSVAGGLEKWLQQHNGHEIAPGVTLHFASETVSGFPFNVDVLLKYLSIRVKTEHTSASWHTDAFALHELTFGRSQQIYEAAGAQTFSWTDVEGSAHHFVFVPGSLQASAILSQGRLARFDLDVNGIGSKDISGARAQLHFRKAPDRDAIEFVAVADHLHLSPALQAGFGADLHHVAIAGKFSPSTAFIPLFEGQEAWDRTAEAWRNNRGVLNLAELNMDWDHMQIRARGDIHLNGKHRLDGTANLHIEDSRNTYTPDVSAGRFAQALVRLRKVAREEPREISANITSGVINLRVTNSQQIIESAGTIEPIY